MRVPITRACVEMCVRTGVLLFAIGAVVVVGPASASESENGGAAEVPTFNADVAPILYDNCASCHRKPSANRGD